MLGRPRTRPTCRAECSSGDYRPGGRRYRAERGRVNSQRLIPDTARTRLTWTVQCSAEYSAGRYQVGDGGRVGQQGGRGVLRAEEEEVQVGKGEGVTHQELAAPPRQPLLCRQTRSAHDIYIYPDQKNLVFRFVGFECKQVVAHVDMRWKKTPHVFMSQHLPASSIGPIKR